MYLLVVITMVSNFPEVVLLFRKMFLFFLIVLFRIILGVIYCASVLVISWRKYNPFSAFIFLSSGVNISSFTPASVSRMIASIWCFVFFPFSNPSIISFCSSVFICVRLIPTLWFLIIEKKVFLINEYLYQYVFFFDTVSLPFIDLVITNFRVFKISPKLHYYFNVNFHEAFLYFSDLFVCRLISLLNTSVTKCCLISSSSSCSFLINLGRSVLNICGGSITN